MRRWRVSVTGGMSVLLEVCGAPRRGGADAPKCTSSRTFAGVDSDQSAGCAVCSACAAGRALRRLCARGSDRVRRAARSPIAGVRLEVGGGRGTLILVDCRDGTSLPGRSWRARITAPARGLSLVVAALLVALFA